ncbi:hypothetical protein [Bradyrhizobium zhanjiangense]|uniref:hypothetical protein n=1 Tax=Bradyrhizobium zhanjiangense TaxID=1325107 RepID=UPI0013E8E7DD|nr:hypothetical protein [Bradyrhizobium zhanjiangense]
MGSGVTKFKKREIARIVEGVKETGALGTFEFNLDAGIIKFHMSGEPPPAASASPREKPNEWDRVLPHGKAKPSLAVLKKVP